MNEALVTFQGWVGNDVVYRETSKGTVANLRVGSTPRIKRADGQWADGPTSWFSVSCWRSLADHVRDSVRKGDPVLVHGRLRTDVWEREDGKTSVSPVVEALHIGHDLSRGVAVFTKAPRAERLEAEEESDPVVKEMIHDQSFGTPQLDSWGQPKEPLGSQVA
jgi:single-strand DNA-binding protein